MIKKKVYKNYKELCKDMNWKIASGNTKKKQIKELNKICKYHKEGQKYIIDKIYDELMYMNNSNSKYKEIDNLIINKLNNTKQYWFIITLSKLELELGLINKNYNFGLINKNIVALYNNTYIETVLDFYNNFQTKYRSIINGSLKRLQKQNILLFEYTYILVKGNKHVMAEDNEIKMIQEQEAKIINKLNHKNKYELYKSGDYKFFINELNKFVSENGLGSKCYKAYCIEKGDPTKTKRIKSKEIIKQLNTKIIDNNIENIINKRKNITSEIGISSKYWKLNKQRREYIEEYKILIDMFININTRKIEHKLNVFKDKHKNENCKSFKDTNVHNSVYLFGLYGELKEDLGYFNKNFEIDFMLENYH